MTTRLQASVVVSAKGGCLQCHGGNVQWSGKNALALAARHYDQTHHRTWAEVTNRTEYGSGKRPAGSQGSLL